MARNQRQVIIVSRHAEINTRFTSIGVTTLGIREETLWELKQAAKWSLGIDERRHAIETMARTYREGAIHALLEIKDTVVHDEIRQACMDAIKSVGSLSATETEQEKPKTRTKRNKAAADGKK